MALIFRLAGKNGSQLFKNEKIGLFSFVRPITPVALRTKTCTKTVIEIGHDERNMKLKRPQSPHLTIYSPQLTSMLSLSHRASGLTLSAYVIALGLGAVVLPESIPDYIEQLECLELGPPVWIGLKLMFAFPFCYHFWNGIRHLIWDMGLCLSIKQVYLTGYLMLLLVFASAAGLAVI